MSVERNRSRVAFAKSVASPASHKIHKVGLDSISISAEARECVTTTECASTTECHNKGKTGLEGCVPEFSDAATWAPTCKIKSRASIHLGAQRFLQLLAARFGGKRSHGVFDRHARTLRRKRMQRYRRALLQRSQQ